MHKIWNVKNPNVALQKKLAQELNISTLLAQLLLNRNITTAEDAKRFLSCGLADLYDPFLLKGMDKAVARIKKAISKIQNLR